MNIKTMVEMNFYFEDKNEIMKFILRKFLIIEIVLSEWLA